MEEIICQRNADIAAARAMDEAAYMAQSGFTSIAMTKNIASGAEAPAMDAVAYMLRTNCTGTAQAATSAYGAALRQTARDVSILPHAATRSSLADGGFLNSSSAA